MVKKGIAVLVIGMFVCLAGCGEGSKPSETVTQEQTQTNSTTVEQEEEKESQTAKEETTSENTKQDDATLSFKDASYKELSDMLKELNDGVNTSETGTNHDAVKCAASLMNWGVGTTLTTNEIKSVVKEYISSLSETEKADFKKKLSRVDELYKQLLKEGQEDLLKEAGCENAAYPWSSEPLETVEAVMDEAGFR